MKHLRNILAFSAVILASCEMQPALAVSNSSICYDAASSVAIASARQHDNNEKIQQGLPPKYSKEEHLALYSDFPWQMRGMFLEAVEFGYKNPAAMKTPLHKAIWETGYENCMYWLRSRGIY